MDKRVGTSVKVGMLLVEKRKHQRISGPVCRRAGETWLSEWTNGWWTARRVGGEPARKMAADILAVGKEEQAYLLVSMMRRVGLMDGMAS